MKHIRALADKIQFFFRCVRGISVKHAWKLTIGCAFPNGPNEFALLVSPFTVPFIFALQLYQQYNFQKVILLFQKSLDIFDQILKIAAEKKENENVPG
jgi:hypothetical protein